MRAVTGFVPLSHQASNSVSDACNCFLPEERLKTACSLQLCEESCVLQQEDAQKPRDK